MFIKRQGHLVCARIASLRNSKKFNHLKMCRKYSKLPSREEDAFSEDVVSYHQGDTTDSKKRTKWEKVRKAAGRVCNFLFGDFGQMPAADACKYIREPTGHSAVYALGGLGYW